MAFWVSCWVWLSQTGLHTIQRILTSPKDPVWRPLVETIFDQWCHGTCTAFVLMEKSETERFTVNMWGMFKQQRPTTWDSILASERARSFWDKSRNPQYSWTVSHQTNLHNKGHKYRSWWKYIDPYDYFHTVLYGVLVWYMFFVIFEMSSKQKVSHHEILGLLEAPAC